MTRSPVLVGILIAVVLLVVWPTDAHAWTHGTHIYLTDTILANAGLLPASVGDLIRAFPYDFLYGSIAPDTSIAKQYVPKGRHSHFWNVGQKRWHLSLKRIRFDIPMLFTAPFDPRTVNIRRSEPITKGLIGFTSSQKILEIGTNLTVKFLLGSVR